jgi:hypothetical protein
MPPNDTSSALIGRFATNLAEYSDVCATRPATTPSKKTGSNGLRAAKTINTRKAIHGEKTMPASSVDSLSRLNNPARKK